MTKATEDLQTFITRHERSICNQPFGDDNDLPVGNKELLDLTPDLRILQSYWDGNKQNTHEQLRWATTN